MSSTEKRVLDCTAYPPLQPLPREVAFQDIRYLGRISLTEVSARCLRLDALIMLFAKQVSTVVTEFSMLPTLRTWFDVHRVGLPVGSIDVGSRDQDDRLKLAYVIVQNRQQRLP